MWTAKGKTTRVGLADTSGIWIPCLERQDLMLALLGFGFTLVLLLLSVLKFLPFATSTLWNHTLEICNILFVVVFYSMGFELRASHLWDRHSTI
jgi:hypothetical protein